MPELINKRIPMIDQYPQAVRGLLGVNEGVNFNNRMSDLTDRMLAQQKYITPSDIDLESALPIAQAISAISPVYHGSPYKFTKFADEKIGTGEGAQAFGYGHYLTDMPEVAKGYKERLARTFYKKGDELINASDLINKSINSITDVHPDHARAIVNNLLEFIDKGKNVSKFTKSYNIPFGMERPYRQGVDAMSDYLPHKGFTYTATINKGKPSSADVFLEWDKPLKDQPQQIRDLFNSEKPEVILRDGMPIAGGGRLRIGHNVDGSPKYFLNTSGANFNLSKTDVERLVGTGVEGKSLYQVLTEKLGSEQEASKFLADSGITGIKYPTGTLSGIKGSDKYNYVVFDPNNITIEAINGQPVKGLLGE
jgi:hypothetical protein